MTETEERFELRSYVGTDDKRQTLLALFPEARTENGKIDLDRLRLALGETVDVDKERYGLNWPGKADCFKTIQAPSLGTLRPCREESINFDATENLIIEGDNLEVLKLLQKSYLGKVKMIYIDPPYNTGNDFIYPDNYAESLQTYLEYTGQVDAEGRKFGTNTEADGRFHSKWLNMMYPRLYLAQNLLRDDGIVFISIDDKECHNLRSLCDQVFGEENFVGTLIWKRRASSAMADNNLSSDHDYVICYKKGEFGGLAGFGKDYSGYSNPDNDPRGEWVLGDLTVGMTASMRPNQAYDLKDPTTGNSYPFNRNRVWAYIPASMKTLIEEGRVYFPEDPNKRPMLKRFKADLKSLHNPFSSIMIDQVGLNTEGTKAIQSLMGANVFDYSKPVSLIETLAGQVTKQDDLVLDFFAGSATTAHAIMQLNASDGGNRKFILVQLPETTDKEGFATIADITKERVRRVIKKLNDKDAGKLLLEGSKGQDRGFRVFKLGDSNFTTWDAQVAHDPKALEDQLEFHVDHIREGRTPDDLLYELLLKSGFPLTTLVEKQVLAGKTVYSVAGGALIICLERELSLELIRAIAERKPERVICLDEGFASNDQLKANAVQAFKTKGVASFKTV